MPHKFSNRAQQLVKFRLSLGFDVRSFADYLHISKSVLAEVESNQRGIPNLAGRYLNELMAGINRKKIIKDFKQKFSSEENVRLNIYREKETKN